MKSMMTCFRLSLLSLAILLIPVHSAFAYLGPGAGLGMIGSLIAVIIAVLVLLLGLVIYPIRRFMKRKSKSEES